MYTYIPDNYQCIHRYRCVYIYTYYMPACMHACMHASMYVYMYTCVYNMCIYIYRYIHLFVYIALSVSIRPCFLSSERKFWFGILGLVCDFCWGEPGGGGGHLRLSWPRRQQESEKFGSAFVTLPEALISLSS